MAQARQMVKNGEGAHALPLVQEFINARPSEPEGYFWQGVILDNINRNEDALSSYRDGFQKVVEAGMDSAELRMDGANDLMKLGKVDEAIEQYKRARDIDPGVALVNLNLGRAYIERGDYDSALKCFQKCDELHFQPLQLAYYKAKAYRKLGRVEDARAQVNVAISQTSDRNVSQRIRQEFADILGN